MKKLTFSLSILFILTAASSFAGTLQRPVLESYQGMYTNTEINFFEDGTCAYHKTGGAKEVQKSVEKFNDEQGLLPKEICKADANSHLIALQIAGLLGSSCKEMADTNSRRSSSAHLDEKCRCVSYKGDYKSITGMMGFDPSRKFYVHSVSDCIEQIPTEYRGRVLEIEQNIN